MQDALRALAEYWGKYGCMTVQPFNTEVGAGTMNPATIMRVLGPEPWNVAYVEPSVRPDDSRYGDNPNRLQTHTQFQVILKPDPGNPQELYLGSLAAIGVDIAAHDIRFVEDNWASPALGAWGLGWEVWLDGMEITQFTYFQQAGGLSLNPVSVEITYGMERIVMASQGVTHFKDIQYAPGISYGEAFGQTEYEMSRYYLDDADIAANQQLFDLYAREADRLVELRLPVPAHTYVLKCSHVFNVLDARGAVSTTERATAFARMRGLARKIAALWVQRREEEGHPLGTVSAAPQSAPRDLPPASDGPEDLVVEIGVEEMPHTDAKKALLDVHSAMVDALSKTHLSHGEVHVSGTPRRIVITVPQVHPCEADTVKTVRGPKRAAAFDAEGNPTKALQGFLRGQGVSADELSFAEFGGNEHVVAEIAVPGRTAAEVISQVVPEIVQGLRADRNMRWNDPALSFIRPIRWLMVMLGEHEVPVQVSALTSSAHTRGLRTADGSDRLPVVSADAFAQLLSDQGIVLDVDSRRDAIVAQANALAEQVGGVIAWADEAALLDEITFLVEAPHAVVGSFDEKYLALPEAILTAVMRKHQRYLPVRTQQGALSGHFVAVANGVCDDEVTSQGFATVLTARYEDASFFFQADLQVPLAQFRSRLDNLTFEERVGSMGARASRIGSLATTLANAAIPTSADIDQTTLSRAAEVVKFDFATQMVVEMTSLAGVMAGEYAARAGESAAVAQALAEVEMPRTSHGALPSSTAGALLSLADRLDLLMAMFAIGAQPTGSSDPYALRRAALGVVRLIREVPALQTVDVEQALQMAAEHLAAQGVEVSSEAHTAAVEFVVGRFAQQLRDEGWPHDLVNVVQPLARVPHQAVALAHDVDVVSQDAGFETWVTAIRRVQRILKDDAVPTGKLDLLTEPVEQALVTAVTGLPDLSSSTLNVAFKESATLVDPINAFFDEVLVMADDPDVRQARLSLLGAIAQRMPNQVDWASLEVALATGGSLRVPR